MTVTQIFIGYVVDSGRFTSNRLQTNGRLVWNFRRRSNLFLFSRVLVGFMIPTFHELASSQFPIE